jgi:hypothetical protein
MHRENHSELAKELACLEATKNITDSSSYLLISVARTATDRTVALLSVQLSTPAPIACGLPNDW